MDRLSDIVLDHRRWVVLVWLLVAVAGAVNAPRTVDRLTYDFDLPGQPAYVANTAIVEAYGGGGLNDPLLVVVRAGDDAPNVQRSAVALAAQVRQVVPGTRAVTAADPGASVLTAGDASTVVLYPPVVPGPEPYAQAQPAIDEVVRQAQADGVDATLTGFLPLSEGGGGGGEDRSILVEVGLGAAGALVVLALVFGSLLAGVPLLVAAVSILGTFLACSGSPASPT